MPHTTRTLALDSNWDIYLTGTGKIALHDTAMATAQNVANEIRRFYHDTYFDYDLGIPHFDIELGHKLPAARLTSAIRDAALRVDDVAEILDITFDDVSRETRILTGEIAFTTISGMTLTAIF